jgi:hydrogenase nickel incorporation protein HypA/HybF
MHEYSITGSIIEILEDIARKNKLDRIKKVNFLVSPTASIEPESVRFYYRFLAADNRILKGAKLVFEKSIIRMQCTSCGKESGIKEFKPLCPACGSSNVVMNEPEEIIIISLET